MCVQREREVNFPLALFAGPIVLPKHGKLIMITAVSVSNSNCINLPQRANVLTVQH